MALRILLAAALSAVAMFVWGFLFWGPVLNMTGKLMKPLPADVELDVLAPMRSAQMASGMYVYPGPCDRSDAAAVEVHDKKMVEGPILHLAYSGQGASPMDPKMFAKGLLHSFVVALLGAGLLARALPALPSYRSRVLALTLVSVIAAIWSNVGNVIWWFHPWSYGLGQVAYITGAGVLMALITSAIVRAATTTSGGRKPER
jgi:hypothetical protein